MSGAQMAHFLKQAGKGSELAGINAIYHSGRIFGVRQTLAVGAVVYALYHLGKWCYGKLSRQYRTKEEIR